MNSSSRRLPGYARKLLFAIAVLYAFPERGSSLQVTGPIAESFDDQQFAIVELEQMKHQESSSATSTSFEAPTWHGMISNLPTDWYRAFDFSFRTENLPELLGLTALTGALTAADKSAWTTTRRTHETSHFVREVADNVVLVGDSRYQLGVVGAFATYGLVAGNERALRTASQSVEAVLATGVAVQFLKRVTGRESPIMATRSRGRWKFFPLPGEYHRNEPRYYAFPSGHISSTMAVLTVIMNNYPDEDWLKPASYSVLALLGGSLVAKGMHWYSDLPLGIAMGYLFGNVVSGSENLRRTIAKKDTPLSLSIAPVATQNGVALRLGISF
jgi:hypothetical protein